METNKISFGIGQIKNETPGPLKLIYRWIMFLSLLWKIVQPQFPAIPAAASHHIDSVLVMGIPAIYLFCQCFGLVPPGQAETVASVPGQPQGIAPMNGNNIGSQKTGI